MIICEIFSFDEKFATYFIQSGNVPGGKKLKMKKMEKYENVSIFQNSSKWYKIVKGQNHV